LDAGRALLTGSLSLTHQAVWMEPSFPLDLKPKQVDLWCARLDVRSEVAAELYSALSPDEKARADRFHFAKDRSRFVVSHGALRELLGGYLRLTPASVGLAYDEKRKPCLQADPDLTAKVHFNASHSESLAVFAFSKDSELGIDIEYLARDVDYDAILERQFSEAEKAQLRALSTDARRLAFFRVWTRKEAYLKATGDGLRTALDSFTVPLDAHLGRPISLTMNRLSTETMYAFVPALDYEGALVVKGSGHDLRFFKWEPGCNRGSRQSG